jgi:HK97 family phage prohead protease
VPGMGRQAALVASSSPSHVVSIPPANSATNILPMKLEHRRVFSGAQVRAAGSAKPGIDGYAAVFNETTDLGYFSEVIKPGAFSRALKENQDVRCLVNHDENVILGRTKSGTLRLEENGKGLRFSCDTPDTQAARDLLASIARGDVDQCSFGFIVRKDTWTEQDGIQMRSVEDVDLFDVSPVTFPAYGGTSCTARSLWPDGMPGELRSHILAAREAVARARPRLTGEQIIAEAKTRARRDNELSDADRIDWLVALNRTLAVAEEDDDALVDAVIREARGVIYRLDGRIV